MVNFRVVSYNVRSLRDDRRAAARILSELDADVVCLQEAPKYLAWRQRIAAFARATGLLYVAGGRTTGGTAMFTAIRVNVRQCAEHRLRPTPGLTRRGVVTADVEKAGAALTVASVHLGLDAAERARHFTDITGLVHPAPSVATVLAGDLNETSRGTTWSRAAAQYTVAGGDDPTPTFSTANPRHRIDAVLVRGPVTVLGYEVVDSAEVRRASDHRPVVVDLAVATG